MVISPDGKQFSAEFVLSDGEALSTSKRTSYRAHVWDENEHDNPDPIVYPIRLIEDLLPEISIASPKQTEVEVAINGALPIEIHAADPDYRLKQIDVQIKRSIDVVWSEPVWSSVEGERGHQSMVWTFEPAVVRATVGDRFELTAVAMDNHHDAEGHLASGRTASSPLVIKIVKADPAGRVGSLGKPEEQGDKQGKSTAKSKDGEQAGGSGEGQPSGQSASGGSGDEATSEEQGGGEGGSGGESSKKQGENSGSSDGSDEGQDQQESQSKPGDSQSKSGKGGSGSGDGKSSEASSDAMNESSENKETNHQDSGEQNSGDDASGQTGTGGKPNQGKPSSAPEKSDSSSGESGDQQGEPSDGSMTGESKASSSKTKEDQSGTDLSNSAERPQKPSHDGEAFERIRDFIQNQSQDSNGSQRAAAEDKPQGDSGSQKGSGQQEKNTTNKPAGDATAGDQAEEKNAASPEMKQGQQGNGQDQASHDPQDSSSKPTTGDNKGSASPKGSEKPSSGKNSQGAEAVTPPTTTRRRLQQNRKVQQNRRAQPSRRAQRIRATRTTPTTGHHPIAGEPGTGKPSPADSKASKPKQGDTPGQSQPNDQVAGEGTITRTESLMQAVRRQMESRPQVNRRMATMQRLNRATNLPTRRGDLRMALTNPIPPVQRVVFPTIQVQVNQVRKIAPQKACRPTDLKARTRTPLQRIAVTKTRAVQGRAAMKQGR